MKYIFFIKEKGVIIKQIVCTILPPRIIFQNFTSTKGQVS